MATVRVYTAERMEEIEDNAIVSGTVNGSGHLILTKNGGGTVDAGNVVGPTGSPGVSEATFTDHFPIGSLLDYIGTTNPSSKWIKCEGQTVVNAQTLYPTLWALLPASMKSGSSMIMPDTRGKVIAGYHSGDADFNAIGKTGGAKTHTLVISEMPAHNHTQNAHTHIQNAHTHVQDAHTHTQNAHTHTQQAHTHLIDFRSQPTDDDDHVHSSGIQYLAGAHQVDPGTGHGGFATAAGDGWALDMLGSTQGPIDPLSGPPHTHVISGTSDPSTAVNFNATATNQNATATNQNATATNNATGGDGSHNNMQPFIVFMKILKVL